MSMVKHTMFAAQAMSQADMFKALLGPARLSTTRGDYRTEMSTPEGESTGGGKQSVQHIKLLPVEGSAATLVMGSVDTKEKTAELRTYEGFCQMVDLRFKGEGPEPARDSYEALLKKITGFLNSQGVAVTMKGVEAAPVARAAPAPRPADDEDADLAPAGGNKKMLGVAVGAGIGIVVVILVALLLR